MCSARRWGRSAAAPPAEMQRRSRRRPGRSNQSGSADMLTVSTQSYAEALKPSILTPITPTLIQGFVKLPCPCQERCPSNLVRGFIKKLINIHTVFLQNQ